MEWKILLDVISAGATTATAIIAFWALTRWRKQDELKTKLEFKKAISIYKWYLEKLPERFEHMASAKYDSLRFDEANKYFYDCFTAWEMSEGMLESNPVVARCWAFIRENHNSFLNGGVRCSELKDKCAIILEEKFVFK